MFYQTLYSQFVTHPMCIEYTKKIPTRSIVFSSILILVLHSLNVMQVHCTLILLANRFVMRLHFFVVAVFIFPFFFFFIFISMTYDSYVPAKILFLKKLHCDNKVASHIYCSCHHFHFYSPYYTTCVCVCVFCFYVIKDAVVVV